MSTTDYTYKLSAWKLLGIVIASVGGSYIGFKLISGKKIQDGQNDNQSPGEEENETKESEMNKRNEYLLKRILSLERELAEARQESQKLNEYRIKNNSLEAALIESRVESTRRPEDTYGKSRPKIESESLAVFVNPICPFAMRAWVCAFEKKGLGGFRAINIDLHNKPDWYVREVYSEGTVPALQYGPDYVMGDSSPMCYWMEEKFKDEGTQLLPADKMNTR